MSRHLSFLRHLPGSSRRASAAPPVSIALDQWLDAQMPGPSTPGVADELSHTLSDADRAEVAALSATFHQLDRLDARTVVGGADTRLQAHCWEEIMHATIPTTATVSPTFSPSSLNGASPSRPARTLAPQSRSQPSRIGGFARISPVLNVAMAALLVVVLGFSAWSLMGTRFGGLGDGPDGTEVPAGVASLAAQDLPATPAAQSLLPTADECTIQPLTVDEVMARVKGQFPGGEVDASVSEGSPVTYGSPPVKGGTPQQSDLEAIAKVQREFVACSIKGSLLQVWAFYAPESPFWRSFLDGYPRFVDEATVRADVEQYQLTGMQNRLPGFGWDGLKTLLGEWIPNSLPVVNPDRQASTIMAEAMTSQGREIGIVISMLYYDPGNLDSVPRSYAQSSRYVDWIFRWDEGTKTWMIVQIGGPQKG